MKVGDLCLIWCTSSSLCLSLWINFTNPQLLVRVAWESYLQKHRPWIPHTLRLKVWVLRVNSFWRSFRTSDQSPLCCLSHRWSHWTNGLKTKLCWCKRLSVAVYRIKQDQKLGKRSQERLAQVSWYDRCQNSSMSRLNTVTLVTDYRWIRARSTIDRARDLSEMQTITHPAQDWSFSRYKKKQLAVCSSHYY